MTGRVESNCADKLTRNHCSMLCPLRLRPTAALLAPLATHLVPVAEFKTPVARVLPDLGMTPRVKTSPTHPGVPGAPSFSPALPTPLVEPSRPLQPASDGSLTSPYVEDGHSRPYCHDARLAHWLPVRGVIGPTGAQKEAKPDCKVFEGEGDAGAYTIRMQFLIMPVQPAKVFWTQSGCSKLYPLVRF